MLPPLDELYIGLAIQHTYKKDSFIWASVEVFLIIVLCIIWRASQISLASPTPVTARIVLCDSMIPFGPVPDGSLVF